VHVHESCLACMRAMSMRCESAVSDVDSAAYTPSLTLETIITDPIILLSTINDDKSMRVHNDMQRLNHANQNDEHSVRMQQAIYIYIYIYICIRYTMHRTHRVESPVLFTTHTLAWFPWRSMCKDDKRRVLVMSESPKRLYRLLFRKWR